MSNSWGNREFSRGSYLMGAGLKTALDILERDDIGNAEKGLYLTLFFVKQNSVTMPEEEGSKLTRVESLMQFSSDGRDAIRGQLKRLEEAGLIRIERQQRQGKEGRFFRSNRIILFTPYKASHE